MTISYKSKTTETHFILTEKEFQELLSGKNITKITSNIDYEKAKFTLSFKGKKRENSMRQVGGIDITSETNKIKEKI